MSIASAVEKLLKQVDWEPVISKILFVLGIHLSPENRELLFWGIAVLLFLGAVGIFALWLWGVIITKLQKLRGSGPNGNYKNGNSRKLFRKFYYRKEVEFEFSKILSLLPDSPKVLKIVPRWKIAAEAARKIGVTPIQTALFLGPLVVAKLIENFNEPDRQYVLMDLKTFAGENGGEFGAFADWFLEQKSAGKYPYPKGMKVMTIALGTSFYYVNYLKRNSEIDAIKCDNYITDIVGMLEGRTDAERRKDQGALFLSRLFN